MAETTIEQVYRRFAAQYGNSEPIRDISELEAAIRAAGMAYAQVTDEWLARLDEDWVYRASDAPFQDEQCNREYRRLLSI